MKINDDVVSHDDAHDPSDDAGRGAGSGIPGRAGALLRSTKVRYLGAGASAFLIDVGLLALLKDVAHLPVWLASGTAFLVSFGYTYTVQRMAFRARSPHGRALLRYVALVAVNTVITSAVVETVSRTALGWFVGKVLASGITFIGNYFAYRHWVFVADEGEEPPAPQTVEG